MTLPVEHIPEDMTATADAALSLTALQSELAKGGQWLPIDPPCPDILTLANLLAHNLNGPRRFGYGTIRDYVIGMKVRLRDGRTIKCGGKVVKNVAGYDLQKLFIGADHHLGTIIEATFKLRPLPETEKFPQRSCSSLAEAGAVIETVLNSPLTPIVLDLYPTTVVLGFDGSADEIEWQMAIAREMGFVDNANLDYEKPFWAIDAEKVRKISVLPSRLIETVEKHGGHSYVARAGNGIIYSRDGIPPVGGTQPIHLVDRVNQIFSFAPS